MKKARVAVACLAALLVLGTCAAGCGSSAVRADDPRRAVESMFREMKKGDARASYALLSAEDRKQFTMEQWSGALEAERPPADLTWKITESEVDGDKAIITVKISAEGKSQTLPFVVLKEAGEWRGSYFASNSLNQ